MKRIFSFMLLLTMAVLIQASKNEKQFNLNFQQNDYELKFGRSELFRYNKDYLKEMSIVTFKYNRTTPAVNLTWHFNRDVGYDMVWIIQGYKFMSNEYRYFPVRFAANACKALASNVAGMQRFLTCGNFTGCPVLKGKIMHVCNWTPDQSKFPPFIPNGDYKIELQGNYFATELFLANLYVSISRPIVKK